MSQTMRDTLMTALREAACRSEPVLPTLADVAALSGVSVDEVREHLGSEQNFAALLAYQSGALPGQEARAPGQETRERIIASAARVFARNGFQRASLDAVAADAGMTKGAIYWHFKNKNDLFFALLDHRFRRDTSPLMVDLDAMIRRGGDPLAGLKRLFQNGLQRCTDDPEWARLYLECLNLGRNEEVRERLAAFYDQVWAMSAGFTRELQAHGMSASHIDPQVAAVFWGALFDGLILAWLIKGEALDMDTLLPAIFDMLWKGIAPDTHPQAASVPGSAVQPSVQPTVPSSQE